MADRDIEIAIKAWGEFSSAMEKGLAGIETSIKSLQGALDTYKEAASLFKELETGMRKTAEGAETLTARTSAASAAQVDLFGAIGEAFYFLTQTEEEYMRAQEKFTSGWGEKVKDRKEQFSALIGLNEIYESSVNSLAAVHTSAYRAMGDEMLRLVETGEFSVSALGKVVTQQVKVELTGLSARAAVWAIYETAMGLKDLAMGLPTAGLHFASAGKFAAVSAVALAGAAGVHQAQEAMFGGSSAGTGSTAGVQGSPDIVPMTTQENVPVQQVTVNIYNPLSDENWQRIVEEDIIPALNDAAERNVSVRLNVVS